MKSNAQQYRTRLIGAVLSFSNKMWPVVKPVWAPLGMAIRFFTAKRVTSQAAALTYSTLLAIVPILAVVFAIARGFGFSKYIEDWFRQAFSSQPQVADVIISFVNSYLVHTKSGIFLGVGLIFMLYTVLMLVSNIEQTFNHIWQVKKPRSIFRTFTDYMSLLFMLPIVIVIVTGVSIFLPDRGLLTYIVMPSVFIGLYIFMPNTHVHVRAAIVPGLLAGMAMMGLQFVYIHSQVFLSSYNAIYGSFAALPLFMLWLQISWTICLFGAQLTYTIQNRADLDLEGGADALSHRQRLLFAVQLTGHICRRFRQGGQMLSAAELRQRTAIPMRIVNDLLFDLQAAGVIIEISTDEKGDTSRYVPARDLTAMTLGMLIDRLEALGRTISTELNDNIDHDTQQQWRQLLQMRYRFLGECRTIPLEQL